MKKWWIVVTVVAAVITQLLTPLLWPMGGHGMPMPESTELPFFIFLSLFESVAFGLGLAFLIFGKKIVDRAAEKSKYLAWAVYLSIAWLLMSWWPHDNLHRVNGIDMHGLLRIEYTFHVTLIITGFILAYAFIHSALAPQKVK